MPDPSSSVTYRDISWADQPAERSDFRETLIGDLDERKYGICGDPTSVMGAALCGDELAVSNACRRAEPSTLDEVLCDDPPLHEAQKFLLSVATKAAELILGAKAKGK
jgi:hypothetical protein